MTCYGVIWCGNSHVPLCGAWRELHVICSDSIAMRLVYVDPAVVLHSTRGIFRSVLELGISCFLCVAQTSPGEEVIEVVLPCELG